MIGIISLLNRALIKQRAKDPFTSFFSELGGQLEVALHLKTMFQWEASGGILPFMFRIGLKLESTFCVSSVDPFIYYSFFFSPTFVEVYILIVQIETTLP